MAVAFNEDAARLGNYAEREGLSWVFGEGPASLVRDYNVRNQSAWAGIGPDGTIVRKRPGYRSDGASYWRGVLDTLRAS